MRKWLLNKSLEYWTRKYERASNHAYDVHQSIVHAERQVVIIENLIESMDQFEKTKSEN